MKWTSRLALAVLCALAFDGCAMLAPDDREFFGRGWINPKELDEKPYHPPVRPEKTGAVSDPIGAVPESPVAAIPRDPLLQ